MAAMRNPVFPTQSFLRQCPSASLRVTQFSSGAEVNYDETKIDEAVLGLLYLTTFEDNGLMRAWKGLDWEALGRLHSQGLIDNPRSRNKSVVFTPEGLARAKATCEKLFRANDSG